ncbi:MAG: PilT/PilU family type 4a pilus ATPase [Planctomycetota bacterium]
MSDEIETEEVEVTHEPREIDKYFVFAFKNNASDLHIKPNEPPLFRIKGSVVRAKMTPFTLEQVNALLAPLMGPKELKELDERGGADFAIDVKDAGRFRANVYKQRGMLSMSARCVKTVVPTIDQLNLPPSLKLIPSYESGLVLVAGVTGAGKSTTLAAIVQIINMTQPVHIVTIENPIEYLYETKNAKAFVDQREVGIDLPDFYNGLRQVLRQDPDVILVGEMRDAETFEAALMAAETGHLVFGTIHAGSAAQSIGRILDYFPQNKHHQIRQMLHFNLRAVVVQKLVKGTMPEIPRVPAVEIMLCNPVIRKAIHENEDRKIADAIRAGRQEGMQDFNQSFCELVRRGLVSEAVALENSPNPEQLSMNLKGITLGSDRGNITG